ncbi:hypothetical protein E4K63_01880 [Allofrancisella inopinata]|uniref:Uncharacterized protein n=1 Tax=Allofrancisella inopinata TaxID=1085647 RepID=A0AAE6YHQ3_9GAMM|nr:hypothetical protein [Allofrancisella inopinata]QIV95647.1 hypothetical protein E4K63_01880 [Allofrancisella inopinata]
MDANYAGVQQRWIIVKSEHAKYRVRHSASKRFDKKVSEECKLLERSKTILFSCKVDAESH